MREADCRDAVEPALPNMMRALRLTDWDVRLVYGEIDGGIFARGENRSSWRYHTSRITFDCDCINDAEAALVTLRHELLHLFHAEDDAHYRVLEKMLSGTDIAVAKVTWSHAAERIVWTMERALDNLGHTPAVLAEWT